MARHDGLPLPLPPLLLGESSDSPNGTRLISSARIVKVRTEPSAGGDFAEGAADGTHLVADHRVERGDHDDDDEHGCERRY
ncbi:hypothetical protein ACU686_23365 [Yinghuangia aomiensis]